MIDRLYVEKLPQFATEAAQLLSEAQQLLGIETLEGVRVLQRYDIDGLAPEFLPQAVSTVLSEPPTDVVYADLPADADFAFGVEYQPGQFDQRADSAAQCLQLLTQGERPNVRNARVYLLDGDLSEADVDRIKSHLINPVDSREIDLSIPPAPAPTAPKPEPVPTITGFIELDEAGLERFLDEQGYAMDLADLAFCQAYFRSEKRDPTVTELKVIDTYWSDHCRHTTFLTELTDIQFEDPRAEATFQRYLQLRDELQRTKPINLMDLGTIVGRYLSATGQLEGLDKSEEINACTVKVTVDVDGQPEPWLLLFKNETHNHPTEIEPFGGAATCIGGAIRDPLSGRAYVYQAMRVTGAADPTVPLDETLPGKLPQRQIVNQSVEGYSSYGNQIGLATGLVEEIYHPGYVAKRLEIGAVVGAAPASHVRREVPSPGDQVVLLGGKTGRDGCGGATGSSKSHTTESIVEGGPEVQKGNAPEERKIQRLFRNPEATRLIKRCNDFGAGGVSVAIGELADGLQIDLNAVPKKYDGLGGTELAISESQERMAVVLAPEDVQTFMRLAGTENLEASVVAEVTAAPQLVMRHDGQVIVNLSRAFLDTNGAPKEITAIVPAGIDADFPLAADGPLEDALLGAVTNLNVASQRGLIERFDSTIGAASVLAPLGGARQLTPTQAMAAKLPVLDGYTEATSVMAYGFNPIISDSDPYAGGYLAVVESVAKLVASGAPLDDAYLTFQEYFPRLKEDPARWGVPVASILGALRAQDELKLAAIGGKDSMSGSFENLDVPPTLVSFAITMAKAGQLISPEFKKEGDRVALLKPELGEDGLPTADSLQDVWTQVHAAIGTGEVTAAWTPSYGGVIEGLLKMTWGNRIGVQLEAKWQDLFTNAYGAMIIETAPDSTLGTTLGRTTIDYQITAGNETVNLDGLEAAWSGKLESVFPTLAPEADTEAPTISYEAAAPPAAVAPAFVTATPRFLIPVFPGTNCEYDTAKAVEAAGGAAETFVVRNLTASDVAASSEEFAGRLADSQVLFLPGGFSGGDEPDGSAKLITSFLRNPAIAEQLNELLQQRDGLVGGICNGFQALIKLGLVPYGEIVEPRSGQPTLALNTIGRHQSRLVRTRVASTMSPWLQETHVGDVVTVAISHGEGRLVADESALQSLAENGQIATQYVDADGNASMNIDDNPNGSAWAIEGITSPDGRIIGKMGHSERVGANLYRNVPGQYELGLFRSAVKYFHNS